MKIIIRNDDVSASTTLDEIHTFCKICDKYDVKIIQAITPIGNDLPMESSWANEYIKSVISEVQFSDNREVISYLLSRNDLIGTHGLIHSHRPTKLEQEKAKNLLQYWGFKPEYAILPFNEESPEYSGEVHGMKVLGKSERLEDFIEGMPKFGKIPTEEILYLHSWRFLPGNQFNYSWAKLDQCLKTITTI